MLADTTAVVMLAEVTALVAAVLPTASVGAEAFMAVVVVMAAAVAGKTE
jgi:hypothetical protein